MEVISILKDTFLEHWEDRSEVSNDMFLRLDL